MHYEPSKQSHSNTSDYSMHSIQVNIQRQKDVSDPSICHSVLSWYALFPLELYHILAETQCIPVYENVKKQ